MEVFLKMARLLIVEDSDQIREAVVTFFRQKGEDIFEIDAAALISASRTERTYKQLPKFPGISRDIAVIVDKSVAVGDILRTIRSAGGKLLKEVEFFDVYEDDKLGENVKSVAVSLIFRDDNKTLTDADIKDPYDKILDKLSKNYNAKLR